MAVGKWVFPADSKKEIVNGTIDLTSDIMIVLFVDTWTPQLAYATTHEVATANGYTQGGEACALTIAEAGGTVKVSFATPVEWTATGGNIVFRFGALINDDSNKVIAYFLGDDSPADTTVPNGSDLTVTCHADGVFTIANPA